MKRDVLVLSHCGHWQNDNGISPSCRIYCHCWLPVTPFLFERAGFMENINLELWWETGAFIAVGTSFHLGTHLTPSGHKSHQKHGPTTPLPLFPSPNLSLLGPYLWASLPGPPPTMSRGRPRVIRAGLAEGWQDRNSGCLSQSWLIPHGSLFYHD